jgi:xanthine dehydrogenase YagS FAD-binding subunit
VKAFGFTRAANEAQALAPLARPGTMAIAGGTELLNWMRLGIAAPDQLIDLGDLPGGRAIAVAGGRLSIGAQATLAMIGADPRVREHCAVLAQACLKAASAQVRNRATIGGNLLQKTRCAYFRAETPLPWPCNKREPGSGCAALDGVNDRHAILGWTEACVAVQPSDPATALACLDAEIEVAGPRGRRMIAADSFHLSQVEAQAQGDATRRENRLAAGELIVAFHLPIVAGLRSAYLKVRERESYEYALVSAAAAVRFNGDRVAAARIALGSVAQRPWRLHRAEAELVGKRLSREAILPAVEAALSDARPLAHNAFKVTLARNAALRALLMAGGAA